MSLEREHHCPRCDSERTFTRSASTILHLGEKTKWSCPECQYSFVLIDGTVDSSQPA